MVLFLNTKVDNLDKFLYEGALKAQIDYLKDPECNNLTRSLRNEFNNIQNSYADLLNEHNRVCQLYNSTNEQLANANRQNDILQRNYNEVINSKWWRLTKPGRKISNLLKHGFSVKKDKHTTAETKALLDNEVTYENKYSEYFKGASLDVSDFMQVETAVKQREVAFDDNVCFSLIVSVRESNLNNLKQMLDSVLNQTYAKWELYLSFINTNINLDALSYCKEIAQKDSRIVLLQNDKSLSESEAVNKAIKASKGEYIAFLNEKDILHPAMLFECMLSVAKNNAQLIYTDELQFNNDNIKEIDSIHYKPDFSVDSLRSTNYIGDFICISRKTLDFIGGGYDLRVELEGAQL